MKLESLIKRRDNRLILLVNSLKGKARILTDNHITMTRSCRNQHSLTFLIQSASEDTYEFIFFAQTIRDWNDLPDAPLTTAEMTDDCVAKFAATIARARNVFPPTSRSPKCSIVSLASHQYSDSVSSYLQAIVTRCLSDIQSHKLRLLVIQFEGRVLFEGFDLT